MEHPADAPAGLRTAPSGLLSQQEWLSSILRILIARPLGLHIEQLERLLWEMHYPDAPMPARFRALVQGILSRYASQSAVFRQRRARPVEDLFYSPEGKGSGSWAVNRPNAEAWAKRQPCPVSPKPGMRAPAATGPRCGTGTLP